MHNPDSQPSPDQNEPSMEVLRPFENEKLLDLKSYIYDLDRRNFFSDSKNPSPFPDIKSGIQPEEVKGILEFLNKNKYLFTQAIKEGPQRGGFVLRDAIEGLSVLSVFHSFYKHEQGFDNEIMKFGLDAVEELLPELQGVMQKKSTIDSGALGGILGLYDSLMWAGNASQKEKGSILLTNHLMLNGIEIGTCRLVGEILRFGEKEDIKRISDLALQKIHASKNIQDWKFLVTDMVRFGNNKLIREVHDILLRKLDDCADAREFLNIASCLTEIPEINIQKELSGILLRKINESKKENAKDFSLFASFLYKIPEINAKKRN